MNYCVNNSVYSVQKRILGEAEKRLKDILIFYYLKWWGFNLNKKG